MNVMMGGGGGEGMGGVGIGGIMMATFGKTVPHLILTIGVLTVSELSQLVFQSASEVVS